MLHCSNSSQQVELSVCLHTLVFFHWFKLNLLCLAQQAKFLVHLIAMA